MRTQISINPDWQLIEAIAIDYEVVTNPNKREHLFVTKTAINKLRKKINSMNPYPIWDKIKEMLNDDDSIFFTRKYFLIEEVIHFPDKIIYVIGDGYWAKKI